MLSTVFLTALVSTTAVLAKTAVNSTTFTAIQRYTQFAGAAYAEDCPTIPFSATILQTFNQSTTDIKGVLFKDTSNKEIVLALRGSAFPRNLDQDFQFALTPLNLTGTSCKSCNVHTGFQSAYADIQSAVTSAVSKAISSNSGYSLVVTGHSLGGGLAALASSSLVANGHPLSTYTFGEPRNGDPAFAKYVSSQVPNYFRITHYNDGVPQIPPIILGFQHHGTELWESLNTGNTASSTYSCPGSEPTDCNASQDFGTSPINGAHIAYTNQLIAPVLYNPACGYKEPS